MLVHSQKGTALRDEYDGPAQSKWPKTEVWFSLEQSLSFVIILPDQTWALRLGPDVDHYFHRQARLAIIRARHRCSVAELRSGHIGTLPSSKDILLSHSEMPDLA